MAKRDGKIWRRAQAKKKNIYLSAMRLFASEGYDNVSIDDIVKEAKSSKGTFYNYFRSKDELFLFFNEAMEERFVEFYQKLLESKHYAGDNALEKLYILCIYILHTMEGSGRDFISITHSRQLRNEFGQGANEDMLLHCMRDMFQPLLEAGLDDGSVRQNTDPEQAALLLYTLLKGMVFQWESQEETPGLVAGNADTIALFCRSIAR